MHGEATRCSGQAHHHHRDLDDEAVLLARR
jgi:hypothetical protein